MRILYITYVDQDFVSYGSGVRPAKMLKAFREEGHEILLLSGMQTHGKRSKQIKKIEKEIKRCRPDLCYIESPTYPIMLHADRRLIKTICKSGIPTGYFYRDFYRKFPDLFPRRTGLKGRAKEWILDFLQYLTDRVLHYCDIIYLPSEECKELMDYKKMIALPPAGENRLVANRQPNHTVIYVGGIADIYGGRFLLDVFHELYSRCADYKLILVCRKEEWEKFYNPYGETKWLEVHHASGDKELAPLYQTASAAVSGKSQNVYNEFAVSVKTFEYLSYGLPQVVVKSKAVARIIEKEKIGKVVEQDVIAFADALEELLNNYQEYETFQQNIQEALLNRHLWIHRVGQIIDNLSHKD